MEWVIVFGFIVTDHELRGVTAASWINLKTFKSLVSLFIPVGKLNIISQNMEDEEFLDIFC